MKMMLDININSPETRISYKDKIFLLGSCFTEHIGGRLEEAKFSILQNPSGILFDPISVSNNLSAYVQHKQYGLDDLFYLNELWQSWNHHSMFSGVEAVEVLQKINNAQTQAHEFLKEANWLIITLGSSFSYQLTDDKKAVANCHRAPAKWFGKHLLSIEETVAGLTTALQQLFVLNKSVRVIFTISPVRHIRDGVIENNRSKARLIEAVHQLVDNFEQAYYFPAYELVIDVLRDYRFYDVDLVHPNYAATEYVFNKFSEYFIETEAAKMMEEIKKIVTAYKHKPFQPSTNAHQNFLKSCCEKAIAFQQKHPYIDLSNEITYFSKRSVVA